MAELTISDGSKVLVDDQDLPLVAGYTWGIAGKGYVSTLLKIDGRKRRIYIHRLIMGAQKGQQVDHRHHNKLDNRRSELRLSTGAQNLQNTRYKTKPGPNPSKYKGVSWHGLAQKWRAEIKPLGKRLYLGLFREEIDAAKAYDRAARLHFGEFAHLNLPGQV
jgi:hypothetical protein